MTRLVAAACALVLVLGGAPAAGAHGGFSPSADDGAVGADPEHKGKQIYRQREREHEPETVVDYYQPAFREPVQLLAMAKSLVAGDVRVVVEPEADRLRVESKSKESVSRTIRLFEFLDRRTLEFFIEVSFDYMDRLERLGYFCEFRPVSGVGGVFSGFLEKRQREAKVFTTAAHRTQKFVVLEGKSVEVYTGRTQIDMKLKEVYVKDGEPIARMEAVEQYCGFRMSPEMTPGGPQIEIDPFCHMLVGTEQKPGFSGPKLVVPVAVGKSVVLRVSDEPAYPQARRAAVALFIWARNRIEKRPVLVFKLGMRGLDEYIGGGGK